MLFFNIPTSTISHVKENATNDVLTLLPNTSLADPVSTQTIEKDTPLGTDKSTTTKEIKNPNDIIDTDIADFLREVNEISIFNTNYSNIKFQY